MSLQSNVETITEQTQLFQSLAMILLIVAIALLIASVVIFIVFKIPHSFRVITGMGLNKEMKKATSAERNRQKATLTWNTSEILANQADNEATMVLAEEETILLCDDNATTLLNEMRGSEETTVLSEASGSEETTVLNEKNDSDETTVLSNNDSFFAMEDDIKITGSNKSI